MEIITLDQLRIIAGQKRLSIVMIEKDYLVTLLLYLIREVSGIYFKGGTALNKLYLHHKRISEDLDFSLTRDIEDIEKDIRKALEGSIFTTITRGKDSGGFTRLIIHYKLFHEDGTIYLDLNKKADLILKPEKWKIIHFYAGVIPEFEIFCINKDEMLAEKLRATIERHKPRDYLDLYNIIKSGNSINLEITRKKLESAGKKLDIKLVFNNTNKVFRLWKKDLAAITKEEISFQQVISFLTEYFHFKELKDNK